MDTNKTPLRIAMVDDDKADIFLTKQAFKKASYPTEFVGIGSGQALFKYIKENGMGAIDLLLLDVNMPVQDGLAVLKKLTTYPHFSEICTVMFSTSRRAIDKGIANRLGATAYAVKPASLHDTDDFIAWVTGVLETHRNSLRAPA